MASTRDAKYVFTAEEATAYTTGKKGDDNRKLRATIAAIRSRATKHTEIAKYDPKESLPVIMQILLEIQNLLPPANNNNNLPNDENPFPIVTSTPDIVACGLQTFYEVDVLQNMAVAKIPGYFSGKNMKPAEFIEGILNSLVESIKNIEVTKETEQLWLESSIWLKGIYHRTYDKIKKDKDNQPKRETDGSFVTIDFLDWTFKKATGLTKMGISNYYAQASQLIDDKIATFKIAERQHLQDSKGKAEQSAMHLLRGELASEESEVEDGFQGSVRNNVCVRQNGNGTFTFELTVAEKDADVLQEVCETINAMMNNPLQTQLREDMNSSPDVRLQNFESKLKKHGLSEAQKLLLDNLATYAIGKLEKYLNGAPVRNFLGRYVSSYADLAHKSKVESTIRELREEKDPLEQLLILLTLHGHLDTNNSTTVLPIVQELLLVQIDRLCPRVDNKLLNYDAQNTAAAVNVQHMISDRPDYFRSTSVPNFK